MANAIASKCSKFPKLYRPHPFVPDEKRAEQYKHTMEDSEINALKTIVTKGTHFDAQANPGDAARLVAQMEERLGRDNSGHDFRPVPRAIERPPPSPPPPTAAELKAQKEAEEKAEKEKEKQQDKDKKEQEKQEREGKRKEDVANKKRRLKMTRG